MLAIFGADEEEFAVDGIAEGDTFCFGDAGQGVEEECAAAAGIFELPRRAIVRRFVNPRIFAAADAHQVGDAVAEGDDAAEIERLAARNAVLLPGFSIIIGAKDDAFGAAGPDDGFASGPGCASDGNAAEV